MSEDINQEIENIVKAKFKECLKLFEAEAINEKGEPIACGIHDAFKFLGEDHHNCLGCNFADSIDLIHDYLKNYEAHKDIQQNFTIYILLLYLMVERMQAVLDIVQVPEKYRNKHFKVFQQIRKWSNFLKHPKSFILTHHPEFDFENSGFEYDIEFNVKVDEQFVEKYYKGEKDPTKQKAINKELYTTLRKQKKVIVLFPDITQVTKKLCYSIKKFVDLIVKNDVYIEILNDETTISNFFENE